MVLKNEAGPMNVALKLLDNSQNISSSYIDQVCANYGYKLLTICGILFWRDMIDMLWGIAGSLERIYSEGKVHKNLHGGNLLIEDKKISNQIENRPITKIGWDDPNPSEISNDISIADKKGYKMISQLSKNYIHPGIHPEVYYTSRLLYFPELLKKMINLIIYNF
ncbi:unnamed protein product [Rhizophagus irregularis]|nr:unnamed protein product [Rhizophagus irregularis]